MTTHAMDKWLPAKLAAATLGALLAGVGAPAPVQAFCGFYVTGADSQLYANATMVVLMRDGTRTVLSMQNNYQGPPEEFALVIPVPTVLQKDQVKVLPTEVFQRIDALGAPRLVEYWEQDPCFVPPAPAPGAVAFTMGAAAPTAAAGAPAMVRIEAQFAVGEYDVVILSADDSTSLDTWLRDNKYNIPTGAQAVLDPYVAGGMKFFVAKVDPTRVTFKGNQAALSPLRFHYDSQDFSLPVRLGLLNSQGSQDLIVNILATQRYELANYPNVTVPTNIRVQNEVRNEFASFYEGLFSRVLEKNPGAVVTEYSWAAGTCDPCPGPALTPTDLTTLGGDVLQTAMPSTASQSAPPPGSGAPVGVAAPAVANQIFNMTLTRLHARYKKDGLGNDLTFKAAPGIVGGRGMPDQQGLLDATTQQAGYNNFQGRYVILHPWEQELTCQSPRRGIWGGPPGGGRNVQGSSNQALTGAAPTAGDLPMLLAESVPVLGVDAVSPLDPLGKVKWTPMANTKPTTGAAGTAAKPPAASSTQPTAAQNRVAKLDATAGAGGRSDVAEGAQTSALRDSSGCSAVPAANGSSTTGWFFGALGAMWGARRLRRRAR